MGEALITRRGGGGEQMFAKYNGYEVWTEDSTTHITTIARGETGTAEIRLSALYGSQQVRDGVMIMSSGIVIPFTAGKTLTTDGNSGSCVCEITSTLTKVSNYWTLSITATVASDCNENLNITTPWMMIATYE